MVQMGLDAESEAYKRRGGHAQEMEGLAKNARAKIRLHFATVQQAVAAREQEMLDQVRGQASVCQHSTCGQ